MVSYTQAITKRDGGLWDWANYRWSFNTLKNDQNFTDNSTEPLKILKKTHFPDCRNYEKEFPQLGTISSSPIYRSDLAVFFVDETKVSWEVRAFKSYKFPFLEVDRSLGKYLRNVV